MGVPNADLHYIEQTFDFNNYLTYFKAELRIAHFGLKSQVVVFKAWEIRTVVQYTVMYG